MTWKLAEAKNRLSEVVNLALTEGPQTITRTNDRDRRHLGGEVRRADRQDARLQEYLLQGVGLDELDSTRDRSPMRDVELVKALLDTDILAELVKPNGNPGPCTPHLQGYRRRTSSLSVLTVGEIGRRASLCWLRAGRRSTSPSGSLELRTTTGRRSASARRRDGSNLGRIDRSCRRRGS